MRNQMWGLLIGLLAALMPMQAGATAICAGIAQRVSLNGDGSVLASVGSVPIHALCNTITQGAFQVVPQQCKAMYATLLAASIAGRQVRVYYNNLTSCSEVQPWSVQYGFYFIEVL